MNGVASARAPSRHVHGRRKGRKLSARQHALMSELLPALRIDLGADPPAAGLTALFPAPVAETWLEIGFGGGEHLIWQALHNPEVGFIGAEPFINGVAATLRAIADHDLADRIRLHDDDAVPLLRRLPEGSLSRVVMLFPDPWPKLRHRQRRLLSREVLDRIASLLRPGGEFRFASDIADYAETALELGQAHPALTLAARFTTADRDTVFGWPQTRYEQKALREGRASTFLIFRRT